MCEDGKAIGGKQHKLTDVNIKRLQGNYGKAIRSNDAPDVKTAKEHKEAVEKMKKAVMASLYHNIILKDDKERHKFCPEGDSSWCQYKRLGKMTNKSHHLDPAFLSILEPLYTKRLASFELLPKCLPGVTQNMLESINSIMWQRAPKHKFHGSKRIRIAACSTLIQYNKGATGKFGVLALLCLPVFQGEIETAKDRDAQRLARHEEKSKKVEDRKKQKHEEAFQLEKEIRQGGVAYGAGRF